MKKDVLKEIVAKKKEKLALAKLAVPEDTLKAGLQNAGPARPFLSAIAKPKVISLIAEIKKASPSQGLLRGDDFNPALIAAAYKDAGVQAISVLTEEDYFCGSLAYLQEVKNVTTCPILRKDFILEPYQIYESRVHGADAVLLIADLLTKDELVSMLQLAYSLGMEALVEVHSEKELKKVLNLKVPVLAHAQGPDAKPKKRPDSVAFALGINNRNLHTLEVDFKTTETLYPLIPKDTLVVVESGIRSYQDVLFLKILGVSALLIGQTFMAAPDIRRKVEEVMGW